MSEELVYLPEGARVQLFPRTLDDCCQQILQMQAQASQNVVTWEREKRIYEQMVFNLQKRVDALEKAPQEREEKFLKLWNWVKALEQRVIRTERNEPTEPRRSAP
jgi:hypothetical protein